MVMRQTDDGFAIADKDLRLRGAGDLLGTQQSGDMRLRLADWNTHEQLLTQAIEDATLILENYDNPLEIEPYRSLLALFGRDQLYLHSG